MLERDVAFDNDSFSDAQKVLGHWEEEVYGCKDEGVLCIVG